MRRGASAASPATASLPFICLPFYLTLLRKFSNLAAVARIEQKKKLSNVRLKKLILSKEFLMCRFE